MIVANRVGALLIVAALVACGSGDKSTKDAASAVGDSTTVKSDLTAAAVRESVGEPEGIPCSIQPTGGCSGATALPLEAEPKVAARFVKALDDDPKGWGAPSATVERYTENGRKDAKLQVRAIGDAKQIALKNIANFAMVMGRVDVVSISSKEKFFGISPDDSQKAGGRFYVIATGFKKEPKTADSLITFGKWQLYGVVKGNLKAFGLPKNSKNFSGCVIPHPDRTLTARFTTCLKASRLHVYAALPAFTLMSPMIAKPGTLFDVIRSALPKNATGTISETDVVEALKKLNVDSSKLSPAQISELTQLLVDEAGDPFWMTCGLGCCSTGI